MARRSIWGTAIVMTAAALVVVGCHRSPTRSVEAFCAQMTSAQGLDQSLADLDAAALQPEFAALQNAQRVAPPEIEPDVAALTDLTGELVTTLETAPGDKSAALEETLRARQGDLAAVQSSGVAVQDYTRANCDLELNGTAVSDGLPSSTTTTAPKR